MFLVDENGTTEWLCWEDTRDWASWWIRQAELNDNISIPHEAKQGFSELFKGGNDDGREAV